jgi:Fe-S-cluster containining protein
MTLNTKEAINELNVRLSITEKLDLLNLAGQLITIGFTCIRCGDCCRAQSGDNCVIVFPDEILTIVHAHDLTWSRICKPSVPQFIAENGIMHAFEWELNRHDNGDCIFIENNICRIYAQRPWICRTYPFYLVFLDGITEPCLKMSDCQGIGRTLRTEDASKLALLLKNRLILEIQEEIQVLKNLEGYCNWKLIRNDSTSNVEVKQRLAVHDSRGSTFI